MIIRGCDTVSGVPKALEADDIEVREAIRLVIDNVILHIALNSKSFIEFIKELASSYVPQHVVLEGEFGQIKKLDQRIQEATGLKVHKRYRTVNA